MKRQRDEKSEKCEDSEKSAKKERRLRSFTRSRLFPGDEPVHPSPLFGNTDLARRIHLDRWAGTRLPGASAIDIDWEGHSVGSVQEDDRFGTGRYYINLRRGIGRKTETQM